MRMRVRFQGLWGLVAALLCACGGSEVGTSSGDLGPRDAAGDLGRSDAAFDIGRHGRGDALPGDGAQPGDQSRADAGAGRCPHACTPSLVGAVFRFTDVRVMRPPGELANILNTLWTRDIDSYILNILIRVRSHNAATGSLNLEGGAGWYKTFEPVQSLNDVTADDIEWFCQLSDAEAGFVYQSPLATHLDGQCRFTTEEDSFLLFHTGPVDAPVLCGPEQAVPHTIPIMRLDAQATLSDDCQQFTEGHLRGCISVSAARKTCFCMQPDYSCARSPDPLNAAYCRQQCGPAWINFGDFVENVAQVAPDCSIEGGDVFDGYSLEGTFTAERLAPERFNPVQSRDCLAPPTEAVGL